jgi:predicted dehydrogenase
MAGDKKFRILVVGCGDISRHWFEYTLGRPDCEIAGIVEVSRQRAEAVAQGMDLLASILRFGEGLNKVRPDLVLI